MGEKLKVDNENSEKIVEQGSLNKKNKHRYIFNLIICLLIGISVLSGCDNKKVFAETSIPKGQVASDELTISTTELTSRMAKAYIESIKRTKPKNVQETYRGGDLWVDELEGEVNLLEIQWNISDIDAYNNGNVEKASRALLRMKDDAFQSAIINVNDSKVNRRPWDYYGQVISFLGQVKAIYEYPPQSEYSNIFANGGEVSRMLLMTHKGTLVEFFLIGATINAKQGNYLIVNGLPVGEASAINGLGEKVKCITVLGKSYKRPTWKQVIYDNIDKR